MGKAMKNREGAVMVLGGGIAGIQAALDLTELGFYVYLVDSRNTFSSGAGGSSGLRVVSSVSRFLRRLFRHRL